jgi:hypothetical protein
VKIVYLGCEGAPLVSTHYGVEFTIGEAAEVTDPEALAKLTNHPHFAIADETDFIPAAPKRRGRPPKVKEDADNC